MRLDNYAGYPGGRSRLRYSALPFSLTASAPHVIVYYFDATDMLITIDMVGHKVPAPLFVFLALFAAVISLASCTEEEGVGLEVEAEREATEDWEAIEEGVMGGETGYDPSWDVDADAQISEHEFGEGFGSVSTWSEWDADGNGRLEQPEFDEAFASHAWYAPRLFREWDADADGIISKDELAEGFFNLVDANDDKFLSPDEADEALDHIVQEHPATALPTNDRTDDVAADDRDDGGSRQSDGRAVRPDVETRRSATSDGTPDDPYARNDRLDGMLDPGRMTFTPPERMRLGQRMIMEVLISADTAAVSLREHFSRPPTAGDALRSPNGPAAPQSVVDTSVAISERMTASLRSLSSGLDVERITPEEQAVGRRTPTRWKWQVTALEGGTHTLVLDLSAYVEVSDDKVHERTRVFEHFIAVDVSLGQQVSLFWRENWKWVVPLLGVLISIITLIINYSFSNGRGQPAPPPTGPPSPKPGGDEAGPARTKPPLPPSRAGPDAPHGPSDKPPAEA